MTFRTMTKRATLLSLFLGILLASSVAFAWWTASGTGSGYTKAETAAAADDGQRIVEHGRRSCIRAARPTLILRISNPNSYAVTVTNINPTVWAAIVSGNATCDNVALPYTGNGVSFYEPEWFVGRSRQTAGDGPST